MKTTYLAFNEINNPNSGLKVITQKEWDDILKKNRTLPRDERRFFIKDTIDDENSLDIMFIEVSRNEYNKWNVEKVKSYKCNKYKSKFSFVSLDDPVTGFSEDLTIEDIVSSDYNLEDDSLEHIENQELRYTLANWKPWAETMLDFYLEGRQSESRFLAKTFGISAQAVNKRKIKFEEFVKNFFRKMV